MNHKLKGKWTSALLSGRYQKCEGALRKGDTFCVLGVLCDVAGYEWYKTPGGPHEYVILDNGGGRSQFDELPEGLLLESGITKQQMDTLISLNDDEELAFPALAGYIEQYV